MPFVSPDNSQSPTDARNIYIGRTHESDFFVQSILQSEKPTHNIISVSGDAGVGKSTLLSQFIDKALTPGFKEYCLIGQVSERQITPISMMGKIAEQLDTAGHPLINFKTALHKYKEALLKSPIEHESPLRNKVSVEPPSSLHDDIFFEDAPVKRDWNLDEYFIDENHYHPLRNIERIEDQIGELTKVFIEELNQLANTAVVLSSQKTKRQRRVLLFFDPFEQLANEAVPWLLDHFLEAYVSTNIILIMAGHTPIERSFPQYLRRWLPYRNSNNIYSIPLNSFSQEETRQYLAAHGITDAERVSTLWKLSRGLPMYLCHLVTNPQGEIDPAKDVVDAILHGISDNDEVKRRLALDVSLFSKPFNQDDLEALTYIVEDERPVLYRWLTMQYFVSSNPLDGRYCYHELTQEMFRRYLYQSPKKCEATRKALAQYYQRLLDKTPIDKTSIKTSKKRRCPSEWLELVLALVTQLLLLPDEVDHINAVEQILFTYEYTDREQDVEIMKVLHKLSHEEPNNQANPDARQVAAHLLQYIETAPTSRTQEFLAAASYLVEKVAHKSSFPSELLARIYYKRGRVYYRLYKHKQALAECDHALEIDPSYVQAYLLRGEVYDDLKHYAEALVDFNRALKIDPKDAHALFHCGQTKRQMDRYEDALQDLEHAAELDPDFENAAYAEMGLALYFLRRYQEAIDAFVRGLKTESASSICWIWLAKTYQALHLRSEIPALLREIPVSKTDSAAVIACRAEALCATKHYEDALDGFTQAIQLAPKNARFFYKRGEVSYKLEHYEEALADFTCAIKLKPDDVPALAFRGQAFRELERYQEALQDLHRAIKLSRKNGRIFLERGKVYKEMGNTKEALQDFDRAMELDPDTEHTAQEEKGLVLHSLERYQEAVEAFIKSLTKSLVCERCWNALAKTYKTLYPQSEIPRLLRKVPIPDAEIAPVIAYRGEAMRTTGHYEEALTDLDRAIELDPENASALISRGLTYYETGCYEEAQQDFDYAIKIDPDYKHSGYRGKGETFQRLERYQEAIDAFINALTVQPTCKNCWKLLTRTYEALYPRSAVPKLLRANPVEASTASIIVARASAMKDTAYYEEAIIDFTHAIGIESDNVETVISRGQVYIKSKRYEDALADFAYASELNPQHGEAIFNRGQAYRYLGRYEDALRDFDHASRLTSDLKHACQREKGLVFFLQKKYSKAADTFIKALTSKPTCKNCWKLLVKTYETLYSHSEIPRLLQAVAIPEASKASVIASRAEAMRVMGYYEEALVDLDRAISLDRTIIEDHYDNKGLLLSYLKQYAKAIENYQYGLKQNPNDYHCLYNIAVVMTRSKDLIAAQPHIDAARIALKKVQYTDEQGEACYGLGGLEALLGNSDQALDYLQRAVFFEDDAADWARHDIAWLDLREHSLFQALISENGQESSYLALKAQSQDPQDARFILEDQATSIQSALTGFTPIQISTASSFSVQASLADKPIATNSPISMRRTDIDRLADILAKYAASSFEGSRRFFKVLVSRADLLQRWTQEAADVWTGNANHDAQTLINWSINKGINSNNPQYTTLGSILKALLPDVGLEDARIIATLIVVYRLYLEKRWHEEIAIRYQVPQVISASNQQPDSSIGMAWQGPLPTDELELQSWLKPEPDMLDVGLLIRAIEQAAAVCRIELPQKRRYGTGFLIAPNLLLTNYHVLKLYDSEDLEENARNALLHFGCITAEEGKEGEGQTFRLVESSPVLQWSRVDQLDYALLQVENRITQVSSIKHAQYHLQALDEHTGMHILQHPEGETMKLAINSNGIVHVYQDRGLVQYVTRAKVGASGSPCFNEDWKVVALHHAERATAFGSIREGILFSPIYEEIKEYL